MYTERQKKWDFVGMHTLITMPRRSHNHHHSLPPELYLSHLIKKNIMAHTPPPIWETKHDFTG